MFFFFFLGDFRNTYLSVIRMDGRAIRLRTFSSLSISRKVSWVLFGLWKIRSKSGKLRKGKKKK